MPLSGWTSGRPLVAHFAFEITLSGAITLTLLLVCSFSSASYASFLTRQSSQATNACLTLAHSFSNGYTVSRRGPLYSIPRGPHNRALTFSCRAKRTSRPQGTSRSVQRNTSLKKDQPLRVGLFSGRSDGICSATLRAQAFRTHFFAPLTRLTRRGLKTAHCAVFLTSRSNFLLRANKKHTTQIMRVCFLWSE